MMYDELVKKLRYCGNSVSCLHCPYWVGCGGSKEDLMQAADAIEELRKAILRLEDESDLYDELPTFYIHPASGEMMLFPATVEEFMEQYKVVDRDHAISNGAEFIPLFRMKQWFEHVNGIPKNNGDRLRAMNNEELCDEYFRILNHVLGRYTDSRAGLLEWLKQPVE